MQPVFTAYAPAAEAVAEVPAEAVASPASELVHALTGLPVIAGILGLLLAWWLYVRRPETPKRMAVSVRGLYTLLLNKYYVDELYAVTIVRPLLWISTRVFWHGVDQGVIDGAIHGTARAARGSGAELRQLQSGNARSYAAWMIIGAVGFTVLLLGLLGMVR